MPCWDRRDALQGKVRFTRRFGAITVSNFIEFDARHGGFLDGPFLNAVKGRGGNQVALQIKDK